MVLLTSEAPFPARSRGVEPVKSRILAVLAVLVTALGAFATAPASQAAPAPGNDSGLYFPVTASRSWDTRTMGAKQPFTAGQSFVLKTLGRNGLPASGVAAVTLNITVIRPTQSGYFIVYPSGSTRPGIPSFNYAVNDLRASALTVPVDGTGGLTIYSTGTTHAVIDITGFYAKDNTVAASYGLGGGLLPLATNIVDTRKTGGALAPGETRRVYVSPAGSTPPTLRAAALNVTVPSPGAAGYLQIWDGAAPATGTSAISFKGGELLAVNTAYVKLTTAADNSQSFVVRNGSTVPIHVVLDANAVYDTDIYDSRFVVYGPARVMDTRVGRGVATKLAASTNYEINLPASLKGVNTYAIVGNGYLVRPSVPTQLRFWDNEGGITPVVSVAGRAGETISNGVLTGQNYQTGNIAVYNAYGTTDAVLDVVGRFDFDAVAVPSAQARLEARSSAVRSGMTAVAPVNATAPAR